MPKDANHGRAFVIDSSDPKRIADDLIVQDFSIENTPVLHHYRGEFYKWDGTRYRKIEEETLQQHLYARLSGAIELKEGGTKRVKARPHLVRQVVDVLRAIVHIPGNSLQNPPMWLDGLEHPDSREILPVANGLLHLPTLALMPHSPAFFSVNALDFSFDPTAPEPAAFMEFLNGVWPDDLEAQELVLEFMGYCLTPDTHHQKMLMLIGPKRSGKGTIGRLLRGLIGESNVCGPTLTSLCERFGLQNLIGKLVAIVPDARLERNGNSRLVEQLLAISGEDHLDADRKNLTPWSGTLTTRFLFLTNELPVFGDRSGALTSRFLIAPMKSTFFGREDPHLLERLLAERSGILNVIIAARKRLQDRGHFLQPTSAHELLNELEEIGSPVLAFVRAKCVIGAGHSISTERLWDSWVTYCRANGIPATNRQTFGRELKMAIPAIQTKQRRDGHSERSRFYEGIGLATVTQ